MSSKKSKSAPAPKTARYRMETPARKRMTVTTKLEPATHQKLVEAARANRTSISTEVERQIERSLGPDVGDPDNQLRDLARLVMRAFEIGGWSDHPQLTAAEWLEDPMLFQAGMVHAIEAFLTKHPAPRVEHLSLLLVAIRSRLEERLLALNDPQARTLPTLVWDNPQPPVKQQQSEG